MDLLLYSLKVKLKILYYDRIDVSEVIYVNKTSVLIKQAHQKSVMFVTIGIS